MSVLTSEDAVQQFIGKLKKIRGDLKREQAGLSSIKEIVYSVHGGTAPRSGHLSDGGTYWVHGVGCLITDPGGREIDVDIGDLGQEVFDAWRIHNFTESAFSEEVSREGISNACKTLAEWGQLRESRGQWYELPDDAC